MSKSILYNVEAREALKIGVDALANAVKVTLGPKGRNVVIDRQAASPVITKDGVSVAREIYLKDPTQNMGAQMIKDVASRTADVAGDGTTTATVLAQAIITAGIKNVAAGANPMDLKKGIEKAVHAVVEHLKFQSQDVGEDYEKVKHVAIVSANDDHEIGTLIADAIKSVGKDGIVTVEQANGTETTVETVIGAQFSSGYLSPHFVTDTAKMEVVLENVQILICKEKINNFNEILPLLEKQIPSLRPLLIISNELDGEALATLVVNKVQGKLKIAGVKSPGVGQARNNFIDDIATLTGGFVISSDLGHRLEEIELDHLGQAGKVIITKDSCTIINGAGNQDDMIKRINDIKTQIEDCKVDFEMKHLKSRLAKLSGGVAILYVGAVSELEMREKIDRIDDALHATRAAIEEGIVAGGGIAFIRALEGLKDLKGANEDENTGIQIIRRAIEEPLRQICANAGIEGSIVVQKVKEGRGDFGYNARTDVYENLISAGVIDPTKVSRVALENASSIASLFLTTEVVLSQEL